MNKIAVLMSTYNGEKYIREQIDSIINQNNVELELYVRDDGSSDNTKKILAEYVDQYINIHCVYGENIGVGNSFMSLLYSVPDEYDFYSFADQDDIWEKNKLIEAIELLQKSNKLLYASNQECVDKNGISQGMRWQPNDSNVFLTPIGILNKNVLCGCTMVFKNSFYKLLIEETRKPSPSVLWLKNHDGWIALIAALYDTIIFDNRSFIFYRQHGENVVGAYKTSHLKTLKVKIKKVFNDKYRRYRSKTATDLVEKFPEKTCCFPIIEVCSKANTFKGKRQILKHKKEITLYSKENSLAFSLKVLFGLF